MHLCAKSEGKERVKENLRRRERMGVAGIGSHAEVGGGGSLEKEGPRRKARYRHRDIREAERAPACGRPFSL